MAQIARLTFPGGYDPDDTVCMRVPRTLIPALGSLLAQWQWRASWASDADHQLGYQAALLLQERLLEECNQVCECDDLNLLQQPTPPIGASGSALLYMYAGQLLANVGNAGQRRVGLTAGTASAGWLDIDTIRVQWGRFWSASPNWTLTYPYPFAAAPVVQALADDAGSVWHRTTPPDSSQVILQALNASGAGVDTWINWIAIGAKP